MADDFEQVKGIRQLALEPGKRLRVSKEFLIAHFIVWRFSVYT